MRFKGEDICVIFDMLRCTHEAECLRRLPNVFDDGRRPWITPDQATAGEVAETVVACPTGALHFERLDGGPKEAPSEPNTITVAETGPLFVRGKIQVLDSDGQVILTDTRVALCRCGGTGRKYCDGAHRTRAFSKPCDLNGFHPNAMMGDDDGTIRVTLHHGKPYIVEGTFELIAGDSRKRCERARVALCSCGLTRAAPLCDGEHAKANR
ncbi:MAG: CDGSH iron-sulfur domain-containing protein [Planctomycetota bacterium]